MLSEQDKQWLGEKYPSLNLAQGKISGEVVFDATYNDITNQFLILEEGAIDSVGGLRLRGEFKVRIEERVDKSIFKLPALYVDRVEPIADRHFGQKDFSACLCSPLEEDEFFNPEFSFIKYFNKLIIPFLYGQVYYSQENRWPWDDYKHGNIGLLQSYAKVNGEPTKDTVKQFISFLKVDRNWQLLERILFLTRPSKQKCPCGSGVKFRDCHSEGLKGLTKLKSDISNLGIDLH